MSRSMKLLMLSGTVGLALVLGSGEPCGARQAIQPPGQMLLATEHADGSGGMVIRVSHNFASLSWQTDPDPRVVGYKVWKGNDPKHMSATKVGNVTSYTVTGLGQGQTWYFAVSSYDKKGNDSALTPLVSKFIPKVKGG